LSLTGFWRPTDTPNQHFGTICGLSWISDGRVAPAVKALLRYNAIKRLDKKVMLWYKVGIMTASEIRELRRSMGLTQEKFAEIVGVCKPTVAGWEIGNHSPTQLSLRRLEELKNGEERR
jgi:DNA-binding transcriptional regulator YiaG